MSSDTQNELDLAGSGAAADQSDGTGSGPEIGSPGHSTPAPDGAPSEDTTADNRGAEEHASSERGVSSDTQSSSEDGGDVNGANGSNGSNSARRKTRKRKIRVELIKDQPT